MKHAENIWQALSEAASDKRHPWNTVSLATCDANGCPQLRTLILRELDCKHYIVSFFTDKRSEKVKEINHNPGVALLLWNDQTREQLRLCGLATVVEEPTRLERAWGLVTEPGRLNYATHTAPGLPVEGGKVQVNLDKARENFAVLEVKVCKMDYLQLGRHQHSRRSFELNAEGQWSFKAVTP